MVRFETLPVVDAGACAAGGKYVREKERVRMAHRHDQKAQIISSETPVGLQEICQQDQATAIADYTLGFAGGAGRVENGIGSAGPGSDRWFRSRARCDQVLIGSVPRGRSTAEMDVLVLGNHALGSDCSDTVEKIVLDDDGLSF